MRNTWAGFLSVQHPKCEPSASVQWAEGYGHWDYFQSLSEQQFVDILTANNSLQQWHNNAMSIVYLFILFLNSVNIDFKKMYQNFFDDNARTAVMTMLTNGCDTYMVVIVINVVEQNH